MFTPPIPGPGNTSINPHLELSHAHSEAITFARKLHECLAQVSPISLANTQKQAIEIGSALQRIASAERVCGCCAGEDHTFGNSYEEMLQHHRGAYIDFERLSCELENNPLPSIYDVAALAVDIENHLKAAETTHQASLRACIIS